MLWRVAVGGDEKEEKKISFFSKDYKT